MVAQLNKAWGVDTSGMTAVSGTAADCTLAPVSYPANACPACPRCVYFEVDAVSTYAVHAVSATVPAEAVENTERIMHDAVVSGRMTSALSAAQQASSSSDAAAGRRKLSSFYTPTYSPDVAPLTPVQAVRYARQAPQPGYSYVSAAVLLGGMNGDNFGYLQSAMFSAAIAKALDVSADDVYIVSTGSAASVIADAATAASDSLQASRRRALLSASTFSVGFSVGTTDPDGLTASVNGGLISVAGLRAAGLTEVTAVALIVPPSANVLQPTDVAGALPLLPPHTKAEEEHNLLGLIALLALLPTGLVIGFFIGRRSVPACGARRAGSSASGAEEGDKQEGSRKQDGDKVQRKPALFAEAETLAAASV
jgi:hypothetical protein